MRRGILISVFTFLFLSPEFVRAQVVNEILYSPSTKSWIEIYNPTDGAIDLSQYKILDAGASANGHSITAAQAGGPTTLPAHEYGVIAKDPTSVSAAYTYKSSLGIKTTGDTVSLKKGSSVVDTVTFTDTADSGNSLQRFDTGWAQAAPTPGALNVLLQPSPDPGMQATTTATSTDSSDTAASQAAVPTFYSAHYSFVPARNDTSVTFSASIGRDRLVVTEEPVGFRALMNTADPNISYFWNFGDGSTGEGREVTHAYLLPGDYNVVLNAVLFDNRAVSRARVKVVEPQVRVAETTPEYVALKNEAKYEMNLYGWQLLAHAAHFNFPLDTIISSGEIVRFPSAVTKLQGPVILTRIQGKKGMEVLPAAASATPAVASVSVDPAEVQRIADKLVSLNLELFALNNPSYAAPPAEAIDQPKEAAAVEALSKNVEGHTGWLRTLKKFFSR